MCGRFIMTVDFAMLKAVFRLRAGYFDTKPRYNIAPGQNIPVIIPGPGGRAIRPMRWGLIPRWAGDDKMGYKLINARSETVGEKPAFKSSLHRRRCLVPASGFYEWQKTVRGKQPMLITLPGQKVFALAGIWDQWEAPQGGSIYSCSIITTGVSPGLADIHNRMPVILTGEREYDMWLSLDDPLLLQRLMKPYQGEMLAYPVSNRVNSPREDNPGLIERVETI